MKKVEIKEKVHRFLQHKKVRFILPIVLLFIVVSIVMGVSYHYIKTTSDRLASVSSSEELTKDRTYLDLEIKDIEIADGENIVHLMANIYNKGEEFTDRMINIVFLDHEGKELGKAPTYISNIPKGGAIRIDTVINKEYKQAYNFKIEEG